MPDTLTLEEVEAKIDERLQQMSERHAQRSVAKQERLRTDVGAQRVVQRSIPREPPAPPPIPFEMQGFEAEGVFE